MNIWENSVITDKGLSLLAKLTEGNTLDIAAAVTGAGYVTPGLLQKQTTITDPKQSLTFRPYSYPEVGKCSVPCYLSNDGLGTGYVATQVGIFATDPDEGEILFFLAQSASGEGTTIPSETEMPGYSAEWTFYFQYGQADGVTVTVDPTRTVSREEMEAYIAGNFVRITNDEIDAILGATGSGDSSSNSGTSGVATLDHSLLYNRNIANQHTIESITGLTDALSTAEGTDMATIDIETAWNTAT